MSSIFIRGQNLDIDYVLKMTKLRGYNKRYKGTRITRKRTLDFSYIHKLITPIADNFNQELNYTYKYLKRHKNQLKLLNNINEVDVVRLEFYSTSSVEILKDTNFVFYFPAEFIAMCGELNITIDYSHYVNIE